MTSNKMSRGTSGTPRSLIKLEYLQNSILTAPVGGFLYDTVNLSGTTENIEDTLSALSAVRSGNGRFTHGEPVKTGKLRNLWVEVYQAGKVLIRGSLSTFARGHNNCPLSHKQYKAVIKGISEELSLNLGAFKVNRCDLALTIETIGNPKQYLGMLTDLRLKDCVALLPDIFKTTRSYKPHKHKEFLFYSKSDQILTKDRNLLRIEYRLKKQVGRKSGGVTLSEILEPPFFLEMVAEFERLFLSVGMHNRESDYSPKEILKAVKKAVKKAKRGL